MEAEGFKTVKAEVEGAVFKDKGSKFVGYVFPVKNRTEIDRALESIRLKQPGASHYCYAWRLGTNIPEERTNDDGEPRHTAGMPILGQLTSFGTTDVLLVVIRYYGGKKLGTGGLINAYRTAARLVLEEAAIVFKEFESYIALEFNYEKLHKILHLIKLHAGEVREKKLDHKCRIILTIGNSKLASFSENIKSLKDVRIEEVREQR
ncbi:MAG: YigZ family protein [Flavobacteriaceae bacterium]